MLPVGYSEDAVVRRAQKPPISDQSAWKLRRERSATSVAGQMMTGTRLSKDWENARNVTARKKLLATHRSKRMSSKDGAHYMGASPEGPFVRGPRAEALDKVESLSWHEQRVKSLYKALDKKELGCVTLQDLQDSFEMLGVPLDKDMFAKYAVDLQLDLRSAYATGVTSQQFMDFHKAVWANQPAAVQHRAGCPCAFIGIGPGAAEVEAMPGRGDVSPSSGALQRSMIALSGAPSLKDVKDLEWQLRRVYRKHTSSEYGRLDVQKLPLVFKDLGLDFPKGIVEVERQARTDWNKDGTLSFHEFVEFQNRYIASLETLRGDR